MHVLFGRQACCDFTKRHTYTLKTVYQLPPSVTTLCCSNLVPLPPDPPPFLLLFRRLKSIRRKKTFKYTSCSFSPRPQLAPRRHFICQKRKKPRKKSSLQWVVRILMSSVQIVQMLHHWHGLAVRVNAHFMLPPFPSILHRSVLLQLWLPFQHSRLSLCDTCWVILRYVTLFIWTATTVNCSAFHVSDKISR